MKYTHLFFDLDHTLWDFDANAKSTLSQLHIDLDLVSKGVDDFELFHSNYLQHNELLWKEYRNGVIKQEELRLKRMWLTLMDFQISDEALAQQLSEHFLQLLPSRTILFEGALEILQYLKAKNYSMHIITNGFEEVRHQKIKGSRLDPFFDQIITSECSGYLKPDVKIFEFALRLTGSEKEKSLMIGDSMEVDIEGARNAGIDQVHVNFNNAPQSFHPTYTISHLSHLSHLL